MMKNTDCLIIGYNDSRFVDYVSWLRTMGEDTGAFRDLNLAFIEEAGHPQHAMDVLNHYSSLRKPSDPKLSNTDFLWPTITYLGTYLNRHGFTFDYINQFQLEKEKLKHKLQNDDILTVAVTTTLYVSVVPIIEIVKFIREYNKNVKIVIGGPYISNQVAYGDKDTLQEQFEYIGADFYVNSPEGECTLVNLIQALKNGELYSDVHNIAYRDDNRFVFTKCEIESNTLEENMVNYELCPPADHGSFISLRTAKSCPFSCSFCGFPQRAGKYKYLSVELVEKELDRIAAIGGVTTLTFIDDTFNVPKKRFKEILRMMIRKNYGFKWNSFYRSDHGDAETIALMGEAGCEGVFLGIESGSDETLERMNKSARRKDYLESIPLLKKHGIVSHASLIIGFPGERMDTVQETIDLIEKAQPDFYRAQLWYCDPVTPIWEKREQYGVKGSAFNWAHDTMDYKMASDIVDYMFINIKNSVWLPQNGFEMWSLFYLQRKGLMLDQVKTYLSCFNNIIKEKLVFPERRAASPDALELLKQSCRFDTAIPAEFHERLNVLEESYREKSKRFYPIDDIEEATEEELAFLNG